MKIVLSIDIVFCYFFQIKFEAKKTTKFVHQFNNLK